MYKRRIKMGLAWIIAGIGFITIGTIVLIEAWGEWDAMIAGFLFIGIGILAIILAIVAIIQITNEEKVVLNNIIKTYNL
jgi:ABC-type transport system involved in multi-copper enzyme maturation permease subunit